MLDDDEDDDEAENGESVRPKVLTSREITQKSQTRNLFPQEPTVQILL